MAPVTKCEAAPLCNRCGFQLVSRACIVGRSTSKQCCNTMLRCYNLLQPSLKNIKELEPPRPKTCLNMPQAQLTKPPPSESSPDHLQGQGSKGKAYRTQRCRQRCALASGRGAHHPRAQRLRQLPWMEGWCPDPAENSQMGLETKTKKTMNHGIMMNPY